MGNGRRQWTVPDFDASRCEEVRSVVVRYLWEMYRSYQSRRPSRDQTQAETDLESDEVLVEDELRRLLTSSQETHHFHWTVSGDRVLKIFDADKNTLLSLASRDGQQEAVSYLLKEGADVQHRNRDLNTPLMLAVENAHQTVVLLLLHSGSDVNIVNHNQESPLMTAVSIGNLEISRTLLEAGAKPSFINALGDTALNRACLGGDLALVRLLVAAGADASSVCDVSAFRTSSLMVAAQRGQLHLVKTLLEAGADVNKRGHFYEPGDTPFIHATRLGLLETMELFAGAGAEVNATNSLGQSALAVAIRYSKNNTVWRLLDLGIDVNQPNKCGDTPLILSAENGSADTCRELILRGAHLDSMNNHGDTALIQAVRNGHFDAMKVLVDFGASLDHVNHSLMSALRFAVGQSLFGCSPCLLNLLQAGASVRSELHYAVTLGLMHVVRHFLAFTIVPVAMETYWLSFIPSLPKMSLHLSRVSPLFVALLTERIPIAQYLVDNVYLTEEDLGILHRSAPFRQFMRDNGRNESLHYLDFVLPTPLSLSSLSLLAVSKAIGHDPDQRGSRILNTGLPPLLQRKLLFCGY